MQFTMSCNTEDDPSTNTAGDDDDGISSGLKTQLESPRRKKKEENYWVKYFGSISSDGFTTPEKKQSNNKEATSEKDSKHDDKKGLGESDEQFDPVDKKGEASVSSDISLSNFPFSPSPLSSPEVTVNHKRRAEGSPHSNNDYKKTKLPKTSTQKL